MLSKILACIVLPTIGCTVSDRRYVLASDGAPTDADQTAPDAMPVTATFGEDPGTTHSSVTEDTFLNGFIATPDPRIWNYGSSTALEVDIDAVPLIRFDLSAIPSGAEVIDAELRVTISSSNHEMITLRRVLEAWDEGMFDAATGQASWIDRLPGVPWTNAGAEAPISSDSLVSGIIMSGAVGTVVVELTDLVQAWVDTPNANFGFRLHSSQGNSSVTSREGAMGERPQLTITYQP